MLDKDIGSYQSLDVDDIKKLLIPVDKAQEEVYILIYMDGFSRYKKIEKQTQKNAHADG